MAKMVGFEGYTMPGEVQDGWYRIKVEEISDAPSKKGKPMITVRFSIDEIFEMFTMWYTLKNDKGEKNDIAIRQLMQLSYALGLGEDGGYDMEDLLGKQCGARLYMEGDFIRAGKYVNPDEVENIEWLNEAERDVPF